MYINNMVVLSNVQYLRLLNLTLVNLNVNSYSVEVLRGVLVNTHSINNQSYYSISLQFIKEYIRICAYCSVHEYNLYTPFDVVAPIFFLKLSRLYIYDLKTLHMVLINYFTFFYNVGFHNGSILCIGCDQLLRECASITYLTLGTVSFFKKVYKYYNKSGDISQLPIDTLQNQIDILLLLDGGLRINEFRRFSKLNSFIIGICYDITLARYLHNVIPVDVNSIELQYFFIEFVNYCYLRGRRGRYHTNINLVSTMINDIIFV